MYSGVESLVHTSTRNAKRGNFTHARSSSNVYGGDGGDGDGGSSIVKQQQPFAHKSGSLEIENNFLEYIRMITATYFLSRAVATARQRLFGQIQTHVEHVALVFRMGLSHSLSMSM